MMTKIQKTFQAETQELLDLMIHSLYSHREIFLRELLSNASDAIEKLKFESLTDSSLIQGGENYEIRLSPNAEARTLTISDNGIGMSYEEVVQNIGTIARSGTKAFLKLKQENKASTDLIGQFGVGFYSAFMVADRVTLHTSKGGVHQGVLWESDGSGSYSIEETPRVQGRGTTITLHLKKFEDEEGVSDFSDPWVLKSLVKKYSDFISTPIQMKSKKGKPTEDSSAEEDETLNSQKALWLRSPSDLTPQEYSDFYKHVTHDWADPAKTIHYKAEGSIEFVSILYIPSQKPFDYDFKDRKSGLNLYVKRVFIQGDCEELLPPYLRFVRGIVDSDDLSLNVSREILQKDRQIIRIHKALTNKILSSLKEILDTDRVSYEKIWLNFGQTLKEGVLSESGGYSKLQELLLFRSTTSENLTTLGEYVHRMKPGQKAIYLMTGETLQQAQNSPYLEKVRSKGFEVLLMTDKVDGWVVSRLTEYEKLPLQSVLSESLDLNTDEEKKAEEDQLKVFEVKLKPLVDSMKNTLKDQVQDIRLSTRLTDSPVCLVSSGEGATAQMERILKSMGQAVPQNKRIFEINPSHPVFEAMLEAPKSKQEEFSELLYQQALLNEGSAIDDLVKYSKKITSLMIDSLK